MTSPPIKIEYVPTAELKPAPYNPRTITDDEMERLKASMREFGVVDPLIVNTTTGFVVGGNQRLEAARQLKIKTLPVVRVKMTKAREKALNLALNKISGDWDMPLLKDLLQELDTGEFDMELTGFTEQEIEDLMTQFNMEPEIKEDEAPPIPEKAICKPGELWILGEHRLLCGDATKKDDVERLMGGAKADMVFTDPPYNVQIDYGVHKDNFDESELEKFTRTWFDIFRNLSNQLLFTPGTGRGLGHPNFQLWYRISPPDWILCWIKKNSMCHSSLGGFNNWEPLFFYGKPKKKIPQDIYDVPITVQPDVADEKGGKLHPTPKQVYLWA